MYNNKKEGMGLRVDLLGPSETEACGGCAPKSVGLNVFVGQGKAQSTYTFLQGFQKFVFICILGLG